MYAIFGCEIIVLDDKEDVSDAEELTRDLMTLLASFSGKYYGRRSLWSIDNPNDLIKIIKNFCKKADIETEEDNPNISCEKMSKSKRKR